jgi:outer membrane protein
VLCGFITRGAENQESPCGMRALLSFCVLVALALAAPVSSPASAQPADAWSLRAGAGALLSPSFLGARTYQVSAFPALRLAYGDRFFASVEEGIGYTFQSGALSAGPVVKMAFGRDEDGSSPFRIAGSRTDALRGLGDVSTGAEAGGFLRYRAGSWTASLELRHGIGGHEAPVGGISVSRVWRFSSPFGTANGPGIFTLGPRATFAGRRYAQAYFGVDAGQSLRSGLPVYSPRGGLISYGVGGVAVMPVAPRTALSLIFGYERLGKPAAQAPLVTQRGSKHQAVVGLFASYEFSWR